MVQGSHIVVPKLYDHNRAYIFQNKDGRIIFAIPYEHAFTLIGTTDRDYKGDPAKVHATEEEIVYLLSAANEYFVNPIQREDVVWTYSGVRPLYDDGASKAQEATRDYVLKLDAQDQQAPLLSIFGGKITTYRRLAEAALEQFSPYFPSLMAKAGWTAKAALPGGDFPITGYQTLVDDICASRPQLDRALIARLVRSYGTRTSTILGDAKTASDLGVLFGSTLSAKEIDYLRAQEWAQTPDDILWRRSKLGLKLSKAEQEALARFMLAPVVQ
jgi:glycerol-3-phosphate dehydrogenase